MKKELMGLLCMIICVTGCTKNELMRYNSGSDVYFNPGNISYNFTDNKEPAGSFDVKLLGPVVAENRKFNLVVVDSLTTAVANRDYVLTPADSFYIPGGATSRTINLKFLSTPALYEKSVTLVLKLLPNSSFTTSMSTLKFGDAVDLFPVVTKTVVISDILEKPYRWDLYKDALGTYSRKKMELMVTQLSLTLYYVYDGYNASELKTFARQLQAYLNEQKQANHPVLETDGTEMKMGPAVQ